MKEYLIRILIAIDQLFNTFLGGHPDETLSAACYRKRDRFSFRVLRWLIDHLFLWQENHCRHAYESELESRHLPRAYRRNEDV